MPEQIGAFYRGTYGYPVRFELGIDLTDVTAIGLTITNPNHSNVDHTLDIATAIIEPPTGGIIEHILVEGDIKRSGTYSFVLVIDSGPSKRLNVDGTFTVS